MKFELKISREDIERAINENYWRSIGEIGHHIFAFGIDAIADELCRRFGGDINELRAVILHESLNSPKPEDVHKEARELIFNSIKQKEAVFIWTVGDEGSYDDEERHVSYPTYNFQRIKIEKSGLVEELKEQASSGRFDDSSDSEIMFTLSISSKDKFEALNKILDKLIANGVRHVYVADDQQKNIQRVEALREQYSLIKIHVWWVNNTSNDGNIAAFSRHIDEERRKNYANNEKMALVLDWDDTIYDEMGRMNRVVDNVTKTLRN